MGLYQYVYLCFDASSLPCLHTFWHAISTSCYIFSECMSFSFEQPNQPNEVGVEVQLDHGENLQSSSSHEKVWPIFFLYFKQTKFSIELWLHVVVRNYCITGNFRGIKFCGFVAIPKSFLHENLIFLQCAKVFSLESSHYA